MYQESMFVFLPFTSTCIFICWTECFQLRFTTSHDSLNVIKTLYYKSANKHHAFLGFPYFKILDSESAKSHSQIFWLHVTLSSTCSLQLLLALYLPLSYQLCVKPQKSHFTWHHEMTGQLVSRHATLLQYLCAEVTLFNTCDILHPPFFKQHVWVCQYSKYVWKYFK